MFLVSAADVAYLTKTQRAVDSVFVDVFEEMNLDVEIIDNQDIDSTDFSEYEFIFVPNQRIKELKKIDLKDYPLVIVNSYYGKQLGLLEKGHIRKLASNYFQRVFFGSEVIQVYKKAKFRFSSVGIPYYYLPEKHKSDDMQTVATAFSRKDKIQDVISYSSEKKKCFFGIAETEFWTDEARELFVNCVELVLEGGEILVEQIHDVAIVEDYSNSVNGIRIKDVESGEYLLDEFSVLECDKQYKIDYKTINKGAYVEDINFTGSLGDFVWNAQKEDLNPGASTTTGSKTILIEENSGNYLLEIVAEINGFEDEHSEDNYMSREIIISCGETALGTQWYCEDDGETTTACLSFSSGSKTRCYLDEEKTSWDYCASGWVAID